MQQADKISLLTGGRDLRAAQGLEIGPRDAPLISREHGRILYADYADAETIRANLHDPAIDKARVVEVDIVTGGGRLSAAMRGQVDYIVASHVAEHVPDLLGWLADLHRVLRPGGTLGLGVPDRRFTFDRCRAESTIAEAVEAWLLAYERPSPRQIFDSAWQSFDISVQQGWRGEIPPTGALAARQLRLKPALELVREVHRTGHYNDAHCWVFTPHSFLTLLEQAALLGLLPFVVQKFHPTEAGGYEFFAVLRRAEGDHAAETMDSIAAARACLAHWPAERDFAEAHTPAELASLRESLAVMQASRLWRMMEPVRKLGNLFRGLLVLLLFAHAATAAEPTPMLRALRAQDWDAAESLAAQSPEKLAPDLVQFIRLLNSSDAAAPEIASFAATHPDWPNQPQLRRRLAEAVANEPDPAQVLTECRQYKPATDTALLRCATAEQDAKRPVQAASLARQAWLTGVTDPALETDFLANWADILTKDDQWRRFDALDWAGNQAADRQAARLDGPHRALAAARLALRHNDPQALDALPAIPLALRSDPVLLLDQARWLRTQNATAAALALWRTASSTAESAAPAERRPAFWAERDRLARALLANGDAPGAYFVADDATVGPDQAPDALFLAGWIALQRLHDPARAAAKFHALAAQSPAVITQARAWYWLGRATQDPAAATSFYTSAAAYPTIFYGQLAIAHLDEMPTLPARITALRDPSPPASLAHDFDETELVRAAALFASWGDNPRAFSFLLRQAQKTPDINSLELVARKGLALGLPDVAVAAARLAGRQGTVLRQTGWPLPFQPPADVDVNLVLGLMRQESGFDPGIVSPAGAVGLMQLMPGTARQMGSTGDLTDPALNMRLGVAYLRNLLDEFGNVTPYAVAAYNAGPHRVHAWLAANGDPAAADPPAAKAPMADGMIDWIEQIPYAETRNYVQRVLENRTVYEVKAP